MHIFTDDWNLEDENLDFCERNITHTSVWKNGRWQDEMVPHDPPHDPELMARERACVDAFRPLTLAERASAMALADGFWKPRPDTEPAQ